MRRGWSDRFGALTYWLYPRVTRNAGHELVAMNADGSLVTFDRSRHCTVVSFRRGGEPVATPVWFGATDGRLYFRTLAIGHKVARIRNNPDVLVAPCTPRGRPTGPPMRASARILAHEDGLAVAEPAIQANFRMGRKLYKRAVQDADALYVELIPVLGA